MNNDLILAILKKLDFEITEIDDVLIAMVEASFNKNELISEYLYALAIMYVLMISDDSRYVKSRSIGDFSESYDTSSVDRIVRMLYNHGISIRRLNFRGGTV